MRDPFSGLTLSDGLVELRRDEAESKWNKRHDDGGQVSERRGCDSQGAIGTGEAQLESHREAGSDKPDKASLDHHSPDQECWWWMYAHTYIN